MRARHENGELLISHSETAGARDLQSRKLTEFTRVHESAPFSCLEKSQSSRECTTGAPFPTNTMLVHSVHPPLRRVHRSRVWAKD